MEKLAEMIAEEFTRHSGGYTPTKAALSMLTTALEQEGVEFGEIGVAAAVIGFLTAKGLK